MTAGPDDLELLAKVSREKHRSVFLDLLATSSPTDSAYEGGYTVKKWVGKRCRRIIILGMSTKRVLL